MRTDQDLTPLEIRVISAMRRLNETGRRKLEDYLFELLIWIPRYTEKPPENVTPGPWIQKDPVEESPSRRDKKGGV